MLIPKISRMPFPVFTPLFSFIAPERESVRFLCAIMVLKIVLGSNLILPETIFFLNPIYMTQLGLNCSDRLNKSKPNNKLSNNVSTLISFVFYI